METNYASNSHKSKELINNEEEKKDIQKVVKGSIRKEEASVGRKFADTFLGESLNNVKLYLFDEVIIPAVKDMIVEFIGSGTNMLVYGSPAKRRNNGNRRDYGSYSRGTSYSRGPSEPRGAERRTRERHTYDDIIFENRGDALEVKDCLEEIMDKYHMVSIADFYELAGEQGSYTDRNYGWYEFDDISITRDRDGYRIRLPKPVAFD